jgi:hypothetical protein
MQKCLGVRRIDPPFYVSMFQAMSAAIPSVVQLKRAIKITGQIQKLEGELATLLGESREGARNVIAMIRSGASEARPRKPRKPYVFSPEAVAKLTAARQARMDQLKEA